MAFMFNHVLVLCVYFCLFYSIFNLRYLSFIPKISFLQFLGKISYSFYLVHYVIIEFYFIYMKKISDYLIIDFIITFLLSLIFSYILFKTVESNKIFKPIRNE